MNWSGEPRTRDYRQIRDGAGQPLILDEGMDFPLRTEPVLHLRAGAVGVKPAAGIIGRKCGQPGLRRQLHGSGRLRGSDAEIGADRRRRLQRHPRSARDRPLPERNNGVQKRIAGDAGLAANSLANFAAQPQPGQRPEVGEGADLRGVTNAAQAIELLIILRLSVRHKLNRRTKLKDAEVQNGKSKTVARPEEIRRRAFFADAEQRKRSQAQLAVAGAGPLRDNSALKPYCDDPIGSGGRVNRGRGRRRRRLHRQIGRRGKVRRCNGA